MPAADCHAHIFGDARHPSAPNLDYRPDPSQMGNASLTQSERPEFPSNAGR
jgi:hypothetical protein